MLYQRVPRLLEALGIARGDGRYARMLKSLARVQLTAEQRRDLMEIVDDRHDRASTIVISQIPLELWYAQIGNPTIADAVMRATPRFARTAPPFLPLEPTVMTQAGMIDAIADGAGTGLGGRDVRICVTAGEARAFFAARDGEPTGRGGGQALW